MLNRSPDDDEDADAAAAADELTAAGSDSAAGLMDRFKVRGPPSTLVAGALPSSIQHPVWLNARPSQSAKFEETLTVDDDEYWQALPSDRATLLAHAIRQDEVTYSRQANVMYARIF